MQPRERETEWNLRKETETGERIQLCARRAVKFKCLEQLLGPSHRERYLALGKWIAAARIRGGAGVGAENDYFCFGLESPKAILRPSSREQFLASDRTFGVASGRERKPWG